MLLVISFILLYALQEAHSTEHCSKDIIDKNTLGQIHNAF